MRRLIEMSCVLTATTVVFTLAFLLGHETGYEEGRRDLVCGTYPSISWTDYYPPQP